MIDLATEERRAWIARLQTGKKPDNWLLHPRFSPKGDPAVDREIEARLAQRQSHDPRRSA